MACYPVCFGFAFYWGFLSFLLSPSRWPIVLIHAIRFADRPTLRNGVGLACFSFFLFFCHVIALGFASAISISYIFCRNYRDFKALVFQLLPFAVSMPLVVLWMLFTHENEASVQTDPVVYGMIIERLTELFIQPAGSDFFAAPL